MESPCFSMVFLTPVVGHFAQRGLKVQLRSFQEMIQGRDEKPNEVSLINVLMASPMLLVP